MIRTGWWTGWDKSVTERAALRAHVGATMEAYSYSAQHGLPVQFMSSPSCRMFWVGWNAFLIPEAVRREQTLVSALVARFSRHPLAGLGLH